MWHCYSWNTAVDEAFLHKSAGMPLLGSTLAFQMCCMASGLLIHCNQSSSQSRASVTEAVCVPLQEHWATWEDMCRLSVFQICGARVQPTYNGIWLRLNSADVFCTICEIRSIAEAFHTITFLIEPFHAATTAAGQHALAWTLSWLCMTPTIPRISAKSDVFHFWELAFTASLWLLKKKKKKTSRLHERTDWVVSECLRSTGDHKSSSSPGNNLITGMTNTYSRTKFFALSVCWAFVMRFKSSTDALKVTLGTAGKTWSFPGNQNHSYVNVQSVKVTKTCLISCELIP